MQGLRLIGVGEEEPARHLFPHATYSQTGPPSYKNCSEQTVGAGCSSKSSLNPKSYALWLQTLNEKPEP